jgi:hypothetical protein
MLVVEDFTGPPTVGRGLPGGKSLSFASPKESDQRKGDPDIPEFPEIEPAGRAAKELAPPGCFGLLFCGRGIRFHTRFSA